MTASTLRALPGAILMTLSAAVGAQTLQINYADAADSADFATCVVGGHPFGDLRACSGAIPSVVAHAPATLYGESHAVYADGIDSQSWAWASFGALKAYSLTTNPGVGLARNTQGRAAADVTDTLVAGNAGGLPVTVYSYTVTIHGTLSPLLSLGGVDLVRAFPYVGFNVTADSRLCPACDTVRAHWDSYSGSPNNAILSGSFSATSGATLHLDYGLDVTTLVQLPAGLAGSALANYGSTVTLQIVGVTPGANTTGLSGYDYAVAAVPEPASAGLWIVGLLGLTGQAYRRKRRPARR